MKQFSQKAWSKYKKPLRLICYIYGALLIDAIAITILGDVMGHAIFEPYWISRCFAMGICEFG